jgi:uncharacterized protein with NRDE domain
MLSCEEDQKLYFHNEKSMWLGITKTGRIALMLNVRDGSLLNKEFVKCFHRINSQSSNIQEEECNSDTKRDAPSEQGQKQSNLQDKKEKGRRNLTSEEKLNRIQQLKYDTRKLLVKDFLLNEEKTPLKYISKIASKSRKLDPFNLIFGTLKDGLFFFSNRDPERLLYELVSGEYTIDDTPGLDNSESTKNMKMIKSKRKFVDFIAGMTADLRKDGNIYKWQRIGNEDNMEEHFVELKKLISNPTANKEAINLIQRRYYSSNSIRTLFNILEDDEKFERNPEAQYSSMYDGLEEEYEKLLSSMFISSPIYSTHSSYIIIIQPTGEIQQSIVNTKRANHLESVDIIKNDNSSDISIPITIVSTNSKTSDESHRSGIPYASRKETRLLVKKRQYKVAFVYRIYDHNKLLERNKSEDTRSIGKEEDRNNTNLFNSSKSKHTEKIYNTNYQYFYVTKQVIIPLENSDNSRNMDKNNHSDLDSFEADIEAS